MTLLLNGHITRGGFGVDVSLRVGRGEVLGLVGRNGSGKSTILHTIAGLVHLRSGTLTLDDVIWDDGSSFVHPEDRRCSLVFQDLRLFPTMSVAANVEFAARSRGESRDVARKSAADAVEHVGVAHLAQRRPSTLSGGERQRVALARALVSKPDVLLLDEPFAAVDAESRGPLRATLAEILGTFHGCTVLVSHDPSDIGTLAGHTVDLG